ncbi:uncharacterized protein EAE97_001337 [Botrytis byssoidea]|uniref:histone acetyltransferase n=1 Tax=Botrytis byssoidea TaxID=139641 RepID=A0A9P5IUA9_9HELO|nr:uncharacterized protein EAE97_001337 [Botrytis byssoidea]KAF7953939.1 hypothetical protein EAE97_001337 [Botrytis byssoidea]
MASQDINSDLGQYWNRTSSRRLRTLLPRSSIEQTPVFTEHTSSGESSLSSLETLTTPESISDFEDSDQKPVESNTVMGPNLQDTPKRKAGTEESLPNSQNAPKRKATEELPSFPISSKKMKMSEAELTDNLKKTNAEHPANINIIPFPEKPAVIEEREGEIDFRVVNNDDTNESTIILSGLKGIFQKQLPKMPKEYIARLVYDRNHLSMALVKKATLEVLGGITYRPFDDHEFAEIVFCAISSDQQVKGYGAHLMNHLKDYVKASSKVMHFLTYADNYAIGYFKKQGFTKEITLPKPLWMGYIKDYEGGTIMHCEMVPRVRYLESNRMIVKQKEVVNAKILAFSKSDEVHAPPKQWKNGAFPIDPMSIPAIRASGWTPAMDELARQPRHGPNYAQLSRLLSSLQNHQKAWPFKAPVNGNEVADYYSVITNPMDFETMERKLDQDSYEKPEDFVADATLVFSNCKKYNNDSTPYAKCANKVEKYMWSLIKEIPEWSYLLDN